MLPCLSTLLIVLLPANTSKSPSRDSSVTNLPTLAVAYWIRCFYEVLSLFKSIFSATDAFSNPRLSTSSRSRQDFRSDAPLSSPTRLRLCLQSSVFTAAYKTSSSISTDPLFITAVFVVDTHLTRDCFAQNHALSPSLSSLLHLQSQCSIAASQWQ